MHYDLPKPNCLVLTYPVITLHKELTHMGTRNNLLGEKAGEERESFASIDEHVTADYPRTFLWCGDADRTVPPENSKRMDEALRVAGIGHEFHVYPGVKHGVGLAEGTSAEGWIEQAVRFWMNRTGEERCKRTAKKGYGLKLLGLCCGQICTGAFYVRLCRSSMIFSTISSRSSSLISSIRWKIAATASASFRHDQDANTLSAPAY